MTTAARDREIRAFVENWRKARQQATGKRGNIQAFMEFYGDNFRAEGLDRKEWQAEKTRIMARKKWATITISDISVAEKTDGRIDVHFRQNFRSSNFSDRAAKTITLEKSGTGFKIVSEE